MRSGNPQEICLTIDAVVDRVVYDCVSLMAIVKD
jgi:hypothetical protein